ncbi:hypothetical protein [Alkalibacillus haloalkaliphilus]|uniref:Uncharacterized protein n=1 Tax=Alkalibacillus haloalkaliphilus TaxID=94136 RepID=A0A511W546_9BACI|nr:hypothetical protein [Alkalibacillus haloalkaliphilus]GEN46205.1 hypothetical protein AHA02nite_19810 [Alkalibacillus haloalkaliphilus]
MKKLLVLTILLGAIFGLTPTETAVEDNNDPITVLDLPDLH